MESTSKLEQFISKANNYIDKDVSKNQIEELAQLVITNSNLLIDVDRSILQKINVKLLNEGKMSSENSAVFLIQYAYNNSLNRENKLFKEVSDDASFLQQTLSPLKNLNNTYKVVISQNRVTGQFDVSISKGTPSKWESFKQSTYTPLYEISESPEKILSFISIGVHVQNILSNVNRITEKLNKDEISPAEVEKYLGLLKSLNESLKDGAIGLERLQSSPQFENSYLELTKDKNALEKVIGHVEALHSEYFDLKNFLLSVPQEKRASVKKLYHETKSQAYSIRSQTFNPTLIIHEERFLNDFSSYLIEKSNILPCQPDFKISNGSPDDLKNLKVIPLKINGSIVDNPEEFILNLGKGFEKNTKTMQIFAKMISPEMFNELLKVAKNLSKNENLSPLGNSIIAEINTDKYGFIEIVLKIGCGNINANGEVEEFLLARRSIKILIEHLNTFLLNNKEMNLNDGAFTITDFISKEVKVKEFEFNDREYETSIGPMLTHFTPAKSTWGLETAKMLSTTAEPLKNIDAIEVFVSILRGEKIDMTPVQLIGKGENGIPFIVPACYTKDVDRVSSVKINNVEHKGAYEIFKRLAEALGEDPKEPAVTTFVSSLVNQAMASDITNSLVFFVEDEFHSETLGERTYEFNVDSKNNLTIELKAISYEQVNGPKGNGLAKGRVITRKYQMPLKELQTAVQNKSPELLVNIQSETKISDSFFVRGKNQTYDDPPSILNHKDKRISKLDNGGRLNKEDAIDLLENYQPKS